jgi:hypothetical protein
MVLSYLSNLCCVVSKGESFYIFIITEKVVYFLEPGYCLVSLECQSCQSIGFTNWDQVDASIVELVQFITIPYKLMYGVKSILLLGFTTIC